MLKQRLLTVAIVLPLFLAALFLLPNFWWGVLLAVVLVIAALEWAQLAGLKQTARAVFLLVLLAAYIFLLFKKPALSDLVRSTFNRNAGIDHGIYVAGLIFWIASLFWLRFAWKAKSDVVSFIAGLLVLMPAWLAALRLQTDPLSLLFLLGVVWIADTAAYFAGHKWGKRKLAPSISPGKTVEGAIGALVAVVLYAGIAKIFVFGAWSLWKIELAFLVMAVLSILGDLFESWIKRSAGVKDSGTILPGHGGILDRIDGVLAALPLAALLFERHGL